jgi:hypothetical protein
LFAVFGIARNIVLNFSSSSKANPSLLLKNKYPFSAGAVDRVLFY